MAHKQPRRSRAFLKGLNTLTGSSSKDEKNHSSSNFLIWIIFIGVVIFVSALVEKFGLGLSIFLLVFGLAAWIIYKKQPK